MQSSYTTPTLLLHLAGKAVYDMFEALIVETTPEDSDPDENNFDKVLFSLSHSDKRALDEHFNPKKNVEFKIFNFRLAR